MPDLPSPVRPLDPNFLPDELLFHRLFHNEALEGRVLGAAIRLPNPSFNREKYSKPSDVLRGARPGQDVIATLRIGDIPSGNLPFEKTPKHYFKVVDDPTQDNPAHAEVRLCRLTIGFKSNYQVSSKTGEKQIRDLLASLMRIHEIPSTPTL